MRVSFKCEKTYIVEPVAPAGRAVFLVVEDRKPEAVYIDVEPENGETELLLEYLESNSRPLLNPREVA